MPWEIQGVSRSVAVLILILDGYVVVGGERHAPTALLP
jgi:hypothetical protein